MAENKGEWAEVADEGIVPEPRAEDDDPQLGGEVTGRETGSEEPATEDGIDREAGDRADATRDGGPQSRKDLRDAATGPRQVDVDSAA
jgi:hypothetical protein